MDDSPRSKIVIGWRYKSTGLQDWRTFTSREEADAFYESLQQCKNISVCEYSDQFMDEVEESEPPPQVQKPVLSTFTRTYLTAICILLLIWLLLLYFA